MAEISAEELEKILKKNQEDAQSFSMNSLGSIFDSIFTPERPNAGNDFAKRHATEMPKVRDVAAQSSSLDMSPKIETAPKVAQMMRVPERVRPSAEIKSMPINQPEQAPQQMNPMVREYLMKRPELSKYSDEARQNIVDENGEYDTTGAIQGALASLGAAFQGGNSLQAVNQVMGQRNDLRKDRLSEFDKGAEAELRKIASDRQGIKDSREDEKYLQDRDKRMREDTVDSQESKLAQTLASKMLPGNDFSKMSATQINTLLPSIGKIYEVEEKKLDRRAVIDAKKDEKAEKKAERDLSLVVPGFERNGQVLPKVEEAQKFRKATATASQLSQKLERMKDLVNKTGSYEYGGQSGTEMESLATEIQLLGKSPELYELGVLTGPDLNLLQKITSDPTSLSSMFTRDSSRIKQIDSQLNSIAQKMDANASSLGYTRQGMKQGTGKVRVSNGSQVLEIPESDLADAEKDGFKRVGG